MAQPLADDAKSPAQPQTIGRYEIIDTLGEGSMGIVFLARDPVIGRRVALKTLLQDHPLAGTDPASLRRHLLNEAASAGGLNHPGIVTIHDVIDDDDTGLVSIAMEYVSGETLKGCLESAPVLPLQFTARVVSQIAEVLDFAHAHGVVHRDIKPANVILGEDDQVRITDFGIASLRGADLAHELEAMGTPHYLAPERLLGQEADHRADIYSLGVVLYEMITRHLPFSGQSLAELARKTVEEEFTPPELYRPDLLPGLRAILEQALAKDPDERYQSAGELSADLRAVMSGQARMSDTRPITQVIEPLRTKTAAAAQRAAAAAPAEPRVEAAPASAAGGRRRRRGWLLAAAAVAAVALAGGLALSGRMGRSASSPEPQASAEQRQRLAYLGLLDQVQELYERGETEAADRLIAESDMPEARRLRELRDAARRKAESERANLRAERVNELLGTARNHLAGGRLRTAEAVLAQVLELDPGNQQALGLRSSVAAARSRGAREAPSTPQAPTQPQPRARPAPEPRTEPAAQPRTEPQPATAAPAEPAPQPQQRFQPFAVDPPAAAPATDTMGTLQIDFQSQLPRGVLTVYRDGEQIILHEYHFVERKGLLRRKGRSGGFDLSHRLEAGDLDLKVYVSGPGRPTRIESVRGHLPAGSVRTLAVRLDEAGQLSVGFH